MREGPTEAQHSVTSGVDVQVYKGLGQLGAVLVRPRREPRVLGPVRLALLVPAQNDAGVKQKGGGQAPGRAESGAQGRGLTPPKPQMSAAPPRKRPHSCPFCFGSPPPGPPSRR